MGDPELTLDAFVPQSLQAAVLQAVERAQEARVAQRLRAKDASLWGGPEVPEVADRLGWLDIAERIAPELSELEQFAAGVKEDGVEHVVLLGMGGSSLAPEVLRLSVPAPADSPALHVLDSTDAGAVHALEEKIDDEKALFVVSSKSGGTIEPLSMLAHFFSRAGELGSRFVAITDPGSGLEALARERGFRRAFHGDPDIGGRYSALSPFGIVPAVLAGLDAGALLAGASAAWETGVRLSSGGGVEAIHGLAAPVWLGAALAALAKAGRDKLTFLVPEPLSSLGLWQEQLWAESTGKQGTGILPVAGEPLGAVESYGDDRVFVELVDLASPEAGAGVGAGQSGGGTHAGALALAEAGHPVFTLPVEGPLDLGRVFLLSELAVATAGWGLGINPFDQPDVQRAKDATNRVLETYERDGSLPEVEDASEDGLRSLLAGAKPPSYVAIMAYLEPSEDFERAVEELRSVIKDATKTTTTFGYGPRFLHSTGQFHKGGPPTGRFLQLVHDGPEDVDVPGRPYSFDTLKNAQAIGDLQTLRELGRPAERVRLRGEDPAAALKSLTAKIKEML